MTPNDDALVADALRSLREDPLIADLTGHILGGLLAYDPTRPEDETIDKAIRMARAAVAELAGQPITTPPPTTDQAVLHEADFTYDGVGGLPLDVEGQTRFGYSTGALSGRVVIVDGKEEIRFFITGATMETGWNDPIYEVAWHGPGERCTLVHNWGDVTQGKRVSAAGNAKPIKGLLWDEKTKQLLWTYLDTYNVTGQNDPCLGASRLEADGRVIVAGPWRLSDHTMRVGGYLVALPASLQTVLEGKRFAAGAPMGSGNASAAWGAFLSAFDLPPADTQPDEPYDSHITIPTTCLIYSDIDHRQPRAPDADEAGWTCYGQQDSHGAEPQWNPVQDGTGCTANGELCGATFGPLTGFSAIDSISAAAWVYGEKKQGLVMVGQLARTMAAYMAEYGDRQRCDVWYGPAQVYGEKKLSPFGQNDCRYAPASTGPGCTTMQSSLFIYAEADLAAVVRGEKSSIVLPPTTDAADLSLIAHDGVPFPQLVNGGLCTYGGAWFEPISETLFLTECHAEWQGEWRPVIHAFKLKVTDAHRTASGM